MFQSFFDVQGNFYKLIRCKNVFPLFDEKSVLLKTEFQLENQ